MQTPNSETIQHRYNKREYTDQAIRELPAACERPPEENRGAAAWLHRPSTRQHALPQGSRHAAFTIRIFAQRGRGPSKYGMDRSGGGSALSAGKRCGEQQDAGPSPVSNCYCFGEKGVSGNRTTPMYHRGRSSFVVLQRWRRPTSTRTPGLSKLDAPIGTTAPRKGERRARIPWSYRS